jgi:Flp pilus assembly CpaF family ATPase
MFYRDRQAVLYVEETERRLFVEDTTEFIQIGNTTVELVCKYNGKVSFIELLKNAMKRDVEAALAGIENPS